MNKPIAPKSARELVAWWLRVIGESEEGVREFLTFLTKNEVARAHYINVASAEFNIKVRACEYSQLGWIC